MEKKSPSGKAEVIWNEKLKTDQSKMPEEHWLNKKAGIFWHVLYAVCIEIEKHEGEK